MNIDDHLKAFNEHREAIFDWAIEVKGLENSQRIVGLHASRGIVELLSVFLHEKNKITSGAQLNHRWFKSKRASKKLPEFPQKEKVTNKLVELELLCEDLAYGKQKPIAEIKKAIEIFKELEEDINSLRSQNE